MTENICFAEKVSDIVALHQWDLTKAKFLGFVLLDVDGKLRPVCLLVNPGSYRYHCMDGSEVKKDGVPKYQPLILPKHDRRVFSEGDIYVVIRIAEKQSSWRLVFWEVHTVGGVPDCFKEKYAALKAAGKI